MLHKFEIPQIFVQAYQRKIYIAATLNLYVAAHVILCK